MTPRWSVLAIALASALAAAGHAAAAPEARDAAATPTPTPVLALAQSTPVVATPTAAGGASAAAVKAATPPVETAGAPAGPSANAGALPVASPTIGVPAAIASPGGESTDASAATLPPTATATAIPVEVVAVPAGTPPVQSLRRGDEVFARIRAGLSRDPCAAGEASTRWQKRYAVNPGALANQLERILPLLDFVSVEVERVGLPAEFVFIPLVESWYKPEAIGVNGPAGMWQMIGTTAKNHGIHIRAGYDGRLSPVESTRAALSYLKVLYDMFDGWEATVMAYNAGEGRLLQAFKRARSREASGNRRRPHGLSNITYDYVSKLQALSCLVTQPERHRLALPRTTRFVPLAPVLMEPGIGSLDQFARRTGRDPALLRKLNPGYRSGQVVAGVPRHVLMPLGIAQGDAAPTRPASSAAPAAVAVAPADVAPSAMQPVEVPSAPSVDAARAAGGTLAMVSAAAPATAGGTQPAAGIAPTAPAIEPAAAPVAAPVAVALSVDAPAPPVPTAATHRVTAGDSLWSIAKAYRISVEDLRSLNSLGKSSVLRPGQTLKLQP